MDRMLSRLRTDFDMATTSMNNDNLDSNIVCKDDL